MVTSSSNLYLNPTTLVVCVLHSLVSSIKSMRARRQLAEFQISHLFLVAYSYSQVTSKES